jgi:hypothetical protein
MRHFGAKLATLAVVGLLLVWFTYSSVSVGASRKPTAGRNRVDWAHASAQERQSLNTLATGKDIGTPNDPRTSWYDPQREAAKIGVALYPGASVFRVDPPYRRGNGEQFRTYFVTSDPMQKVAEFYGADTVAQWQLHDNGKGGLISSPVDVANSPDILIMELWPKPNQTGIYILRIHSCAGMFPSPCDAPAPGL